MDYITEYFNYLANEKEVSDNTLKSYKLDITQFQEYINKLNINITNVTIEHIEQYKTYMKQEKRYTNRTRSRKLTAIKDFYTYISKKHNISNPAKDIEFPPISKRNPTYLTVEEAQKIVNATKTQPEPYKSRDKLILLLFLTTGLRVSELTNIKVTDIDGNILRVIGKGDKERIVVLNRDVIKALKRYLKVRKDVSDYLFISKFNRHMSVRSVQNVVEKYIKLAGLTKHLSAHSLRHTAATFMLKGKKDIRTIQQVLGHSNIQTTQIYTHVDEDMLEDAANATLGMFD